jgi:spore coat polysaccharide biosynthesis predicted glycosyltransferase SpsG
VARILLRCDATSRTGFGHLSRCLALAEALEEEGATCGFMGTFEPAAQVLLASTTFRWKAARGPSGGGDDLDGVTAELDQDTIVIIDGYWIEPRYVEALAARARRLVLIDDFAALAAYPAGSTVLNLTVGAAGDGARARYPRSVRTLLGPSFFLARRQLRAVRRERRMPPPRAERVLVSIGGVDRHGLSLLVAEALAEVAPTATVTVVAGSPSPVIDELASRARAGRLRAAVHVGLPGLAPALAAADAVVSGGGLTKYEAAYVGLPTAVLSQTEEQATETREFVARGLALDLGLGAAVTQEVLAAGLARLVHDVDTRRALHAACGRAFPVDPTADAARAVLEDTAP